MCSFAKCSFNKIMNAYVSAYLCTTLLYEQRINPPQSTCPPTIQFLHIRINHIAIRMTFPSHFSHSIVCTYSRKKTPNDSKKNIHCSPLNALTKRSNGLKWNEKELAQTTDVNKNMLTFLLTIMRNRYHIYLSRFSEWTLCDLNKKIHAFFVQLDFCSWMHIKGALRFVFIKLELLCYMLPARLSFSLSFDIIKKRGFFYDKGEMCSMKHENEWMSFSDSSEYNRSCFVSYALIWLMRFL